MSCFHINPNFLHYVSKSSDTAPSAPIITWMTITFFLVASSLLTLPYFHSFLALSLSLENPTTLQHQRSCIPFHLHLPLRCLIVVFQSRGRIQCWNSTIPCCFYFSLRFTFVPFVYPFEISSPHNSQWIFLVLSFLLLYSRWLIDWLFGITCRVNSKVIGGIKMLENLWC